MKSRTKQSLMKRVNSQSSFNTTCKSSDNGTPYELLHRTVSQHAAIIPFLLLTVAGVSTAIAQRARAAKTNTSDTVSVIDTATNTVVATIDFPVGLGPIAIAITPDGTRAYVTSNGSNTVTVIDTATNTVVATVTVGQGPLRGVAITPDGAGADVTDQGSN